MLVVISEVMGEHALSFSLLDFRKISSTAQMFLSHHVRLQNVRQNGSMELSGLACVPLAGSSEPQAPDGREQPRREAVVPIHRMQVRRCIFEMSELQNLEPWANC